MYTWKKSTSIAIKLIISPTVFSLRADADKRRVWIPLCCFPLSCAYTSSNSDGNQTYRESLMKIKKTKNLSVDSCSESRLNLDSHSEHYVEIGIHYDWSNLNIHIKRDGGGRNGWSTSETVNMRIAYDTPCQKGDSGADTNPINWLQLYTLIHDTVHTNKANI